MKLSETGLTAEELKGLVKKQPRICISMTKRATLTSISMQVSP